MLVSVAYTGMMWGIPRSIYPSVYTLGVREVWNLLAVLVQHTLHVAGIHRSSLVGSTKHGRTHRAKEGYSAQPGAEGGGRRRVACKETDWLCFSLCTFALPLSPSFLLYLFIFFLLAGFGRCLELGDVHTSKTQASSVLILGNGSGVEVNPSSSNIQHL